jgi:hypothetical protein
LLDVYCTACRHQLASRWNHSHHEKVGSQLRFYRPFRGKGICATVGEFMRADGIRCFANELQLILVEK